MALSDKVRDHMRRKQAGAFAVVQALARTAEGEMKAKAPWRDQTATARRALHAGAEPMTGKRIRMYFAHGVKYGRYLEEGTRPHLIQPKNKKALYWRGAAHPIRGAVKHPGTKPRAIVVPTAKRYVKKAGEELVKWWCR